MVPQFSPFGVHWSLRGRKYSYCESTTAAHFSDLFRYVIPLCASKDPKDEASELLQEVAGWNFNSAWFAMLRKEAAGAS